MGDQLDRLRPFLTQESTMSVLMTMTLAAAVGIVFAAGLCAFVLRIIPGVEPTSADINVSQPSR